MIYQADTGNTVSIILSVAVVGFILYSFIRARRRMNRPASEHIKILDDSNFDNTVRTGVSLVDFWAEWCGPCKVQGPIVDEVADEMGDAANVCKLDVDKNPRTSQKFGIRNIPTILILKDGKPVEKFVGVKQKQVLLKAIKSHL